MAINKPIEIQWKGKTHSILLTMRDVDRIDEELNLMRFVSRISTGELRYAHACKFIASVLSSAGVSCTQQDVWDDIYGGDEDSIAVEQVQEICWTMIGCCFPELKQKKTTQEA